MWDPLIHVVAHAAATAAGKPFVLTPHGMLDPWAMSQRWWKKRAAMVLGYRRMLNNAAFLHFLNADECTLTTRLHLTSPSRILPNGIFLQELDPLPEKGALRATHSEFAKSRLVLFLSRLHYKKGLDFLADAFAIVAREFPDAQLIVAGPDDGARAPFLAQIARLDIRGEFISSAPFMPPRRLPPFATAIASVCPAGRKDSAWPSLKRWPANPRS